MSPSKQTIYWGCIYLQPPFRLRNKHMRAVIAVDSKQAPKVIEVETACVIFGNFETFSKLLFGELQLQACINSH